MEVKDGVLNHKCKNATNGLYAYNSLKILKQQEMTPTIGMMIKKEITINNYNRNITKTTIK